MRRNTAIAYREPADSDQRQSAELSWPSFRAAEGDKRLDHFVHQEGKVFAGTHLILDLWGATRLDDLTLMEQLRRHLS